MLTSAPEGLSVDSFESELTQNILPFWMNHTLDRQKGGFFGALSNDLQIFDEVERSAILNSRILWTFSKAALVYPEESYLQTAEWAFKYLTAYFWDETYQGIFWSLNHQGQPANERKHTYAQAFAIYGLSAYYQAGGDPKSLELAKILFQLIEDHTFDELNGGNIECRSRDWGTLEDMRLSDKELNSAKSMNTLLHLMEAYSALYEIWPGETLLQKLKDLAKVFLNHIIDPVNGHQHLLFDEHWNSLSKQISYGHDIEASWLLVEAAERVKDPALLEQAIRTVLILADAVYAQALGEDGSIIYEIDADGKKNDQRHWWAHAEAVVGFYNAYQLGGELRFTEAAEKVWKYIQNNFVDRQHGDWFKVLEADGTPIAAQYKAGPWECPYHHARMCMEMSRRLKGK